MERAVRPGEILIPVKFSNTPGTFKKTVNGVIIIISIILSLMKCFLSFANFKLTRRSIINIPIINESNWLIKRRVSSLNSKIRSHIDKNIIIRESIIIITLYIRIKVCIKGFCEFVLYKIHPLATFN